MHECRFTGTGRSHNRCHLASMNRQIDALKCLKMDLSRPVDLDAIGQLDKRCG
jgi:hypothetical protein